MGAAVVIFSYNILRSFEIALRMLISFRHARPFHLGDDFVRLLEGLSGGDTTITITLILGVFAVAHSGLASLRPKVCRQHRRLWHSRETTAIV